MLKFSKLLKNSVNQNKCQISVGNKTQFSSSSPAHMRHRPGRPRNSPGGLMPSGRRHWGRNGGRTNFGCCQSQLQQGPML